VEVNYKPSEVKLSNFNNCPGSDMASAILTKTFGNKWQAVDLIDMDYWVNDEATLVFTVGDRQKTYTLLQMLRFADSFKELMTDEFTWADSNAVVVRMWWD
jgi:hypothetical protein